MLFLLISYLSDLSLDRSLLSQTAPCHSCRGRIIIHSKFHILVFFPESSFFVSSSNILLKDSDSQLSLLNLSNKSMGVGIYAVWMKNVSLDQSPGPEIKHYVILVNSITWNYERLNMKMHPGKYKNTTETHSLCSNYSKPPPLQRMSPNGEELVENWKLP